MRRRRRSAGHKFWRPGSGSQRREREDAEPAALTAAASPAAAVTAAATATRCAALLRGGMSPTQTVSAVAQDLRGSETIEVARLVGDGSGVGAAFARVDGPEWRVLGAAWMLAETSGAPFAPALDRIAAALNGVADVEQKREVLLAGPRMTARLVGWLPLAAVAVGFLLGFDPLPVFFTPLGGVLLIGGLLLQYLGLRWANSLTGQVAGLDRVAGLECELMWIALAGGAPPSEALRRVADAASDCRAEWIEFASLRAGRPLASALATATAVGVSASPLLVDAANKLRAATQSQLEREAERLGVRILIPLACCVLPSFVAIGVVPVIVTLLGDLLLR
ncbi:type II secretion system F family protein [Leucobacter sp. BZR 635]